MTKGVHVRKVIPSGESETVEFKSGFDKDTIETLAAFANTKGSKVFVGISNKKVAEVFKEAGLIEKYGSGIGRILKAFRDYGLPTPKFEEVSGGFMVTVYKKTPQVTEEVGTKSAPS